MPDFSVGGPVWPVRVDLGLLSTLCVVLFPCLLGFEFSKSHVSPVSKSTIKGSFVQPAMLGCYQACLEPKLVCKLQDPFP